MHFAKRVDGIDSSFIREILKLTQSKDIISFAGGLPNPNLFPTEEFESAARKILSDKQSAQKALQYGESAGLKELIEIIVRSYKAKDDLDIDPDLVLITNGSQQALDLISKIYIEKDDKIALESPTYLAALQSFSFYSNNFTALSLEHDGPAPDSLEDIKDAKLFYGIVNFQNPSGVTWSNKKRKQVAEFCDENDVLFVEDDPYGEIRFEGERQKPMKTFAKNIVMLGSFSKILAPGLRLGWIVAPNREFFEKLILAKQASDLHTSQFTQMIAAEFYKDFDAQAHIEKIAALYGKQKNVMQESLRKYLPEAKFKSPQGGMFLWIEFSEFVDSKEFLKFAVKEGVAFVPGEAFFAQKDTSRNFARLNFTNADEKGIEEGVKRLSLAYKKYLNSLK